MAKCILNFHSKIFSVSNLIDIDFTLSFDKKRQTNTNLTLPIQGVLAQYNFWDFEKIVLCEIHTSEYQIAKFPLVLILLHSNSTSTNFIPMAVKFVLVEIVLVETVLVGDLLQIEPKKVQLVAKKSTARVQRILPIFFAVDHPLCNV